MGKEVYKPWHRRSVPDPVYKDLPIEWNPIIKYPTSTSDTLATHILNKTTQIHKYKYLNMILE